MKRKGTIAPFFFVGEGNSKWKCGCEVGLNCTRDSDGRSKPSGKFYDPAHTMRVKYTSLNPHLCRCWLSGNSDGFPLNEDIRHIHT